MATPLAAPRSPTVPRADALAPPLALAGRILYGAIFVLAAPNHFRSGTIAYAAHAGVPAAHVLVPLAGLLAFAGGASILLGFHARVGALLLVAFLVPVTLTMHAFWAVHDPMMAQVEMGNFLKNASMLGAALLVAAFGAGPWSLDARRARSR